MRKLRKMMKFIEKCGFGSQKRDPDFRSTWPNSFQLEKVSDNRKCVNPFYTVCQCFRALREDVAPGDSCPLLGESKPSDLGGEYLNTRPMGRAGLPVHPVMLLHCAFVPKHSVAEEPKPVHCVSGSSSLQVKRWFWPSGSLNWRIQTKKVG